MMNKKRSHGIGRAKYLIFIPLAAFLMLLSNIEAVARITGEIAAGAVAGVKEATELTIVPEEEVKVSGQVIDDFNSPISGANVIIKGTSIGTITDIEGRFVLETTKNAIIQFSFIGFKEKEVAVKDVMGNLKVQLYSEGGTGQSQSSGANPQAIVNPSTVRSDQVFNVVEEQPEFPGGQGALLTFLSKNIKYPVIAQENGIEGRVTTSFIIETDGSIRNIEVVRGVDPSLDIEAVRVISTMPKWKPGRQRGKEVAVKFTVPVTFRLQGGSKDKVTSKDYDNAGIVVVGYGDKKDSNASATPENNDMVFTVVQNPPEFPGGQGALLEYIAKSVQYPVEAQSAGIQGRVTCSFIVNKDGTISNPEVLHSIEPSLDKEALRVISSMPKWIPGTQRGKAVRVKFTVPVTFRLQ